MKKLISAILILVFVLSVGPLTFAGYDALAITNSPTDKVRAAGESAIFTSGATGYSTLSWTFVSPSGIPCSVQDFLCRFPDADVEGNNTTTLMIKNLETGMNNWGVFCSFFNGETEVDTAVAHLHVQAGHAAVSVPAKPVPAPVIST